MMMIQMMRGGFLLLPASSTSSSSLELSMRLPRNELEITRKAIQVVLAGASIWSLIVSAGLFADPEIDS